MTGEMPWVLTLVMTMLVSSLSSAGLWNYLTRKNEKNNATTQLLLGLAHDRIIYLGMNYIERGYITKDEYDDLLRYLYNPYSKFGGNGLAERVMEAVSSLPIQNRTTIKRRCCPSRVMSIISHDREKFNVERGCRCGHVLRH